MPVKRQCGLTAVLVLTTVVTPCIGLAQLGGTLSIRKRILTPGEPVTIIFKATNLGVNPVQVPVTDIYGPCGSPYRIAINGTEYRPQLWAGHEIVAVCPYGSRQLEPGQSYEEEYAIAPKQLNRSGAYKIAVRRPLPYEFRNRLPNRTSPFQLFAAQFEVIVTGHATPSQKR